MNEFSQTLVEAARRRVGTPFYGHYEGGDSCHHGRVTHPSCMMRGLDDRGYDCSGLVIASLSEVLQIDARRWPPRFRHLAQLSRLAVEATPDEGDVVVLDADHPQVKAEPGHMGIYSGHEHLIHASRARLASQAF